VYICIMENNIKGRFAPSPTGRMHLGNIFSALLSWLSAKAQGGTWLLRIEDIDPQRSRREFAEWIMDDLDWLGLSWDEGPQVGGANGPYYQSERGAVYEHYLHRLQEEGLVYPCYCTRADILATQAPHESDGRVVYKGTCRHLPPESRHGQAAMRMMVPDAGMGTRTFTDGHYGVQTVDLTTQCGDFIVRRKDGAWAYQLAVVVDDALMGVTEVVRGRDLLLSSPQQIYLAGCLGFTPPRFTHLPLLCNAAGQRLSKRDKSMDMATLRNRHSAKEIIGMLAYTAGLLPAPTPMTPRELTGLFDWNNVSRDSIYV
jgi:glutamyl-tRNA synthetase